MFASETLKCGRILQDINKFCSIYIMQSRDTSPSFTACYKVYITIKHKNNQSDTRIKACFVFIKKHKVHNEVQLIDGHLERVE